MNNMPKKLRDQLAKDPEYKVCARLGSDWREGQCEGRITFEHALTYAGKQIQERFAIIPLCVFHHLGKGLNKRWNIRYAMWRASPEDRAKYPRLNWTLEKYSPKQTIEPIMW